MVTAKCIYRQKYCTIYGEIQGVCYFGKNIGDCSLYKDYSDTDGEDCHFAEWFSVTIYDKFQSVEITPEIVRLGQITIDKQNVIELLIDYGDKKGFIPEIVHS